MKPHNQKNEEALNQLNVEVEENLTAKKLEPVHAGRSNKVYDITEIPFSAVVLKAQEVLSDLSVEDNLNIALQIRSQLAAKQKTANDLIDKIESTVKNQNLQAGEYGFLSTVKVGWAKKTVVNEEATFNYIKKVLKLNPLDYAKLDTSNVVVKDIINKNPELSEVILQGTKRHSFK